jgi:hypothetical protein
LTETNDETMISKALSVCVGDFMFCFRNKQQGRRRRSKQHCPSSIPSNFIMVVIQFVRGGGGAFLSTNGRSLPRVVVGGGKKRRETGGFVCPHCTQQIVGGTTIHTTVVSVYYHHHHPVTYTASKYEEDGKHTIVSIFLLMETLICVFPVRTSNTERKPSYFWLMPRRVTLARTDYCSRDAGFGISGWGGNSSCDSCCCCSGAADNTNDSSSPPNSSTVSIGDGS